MTALIATLALLHQNPNDPCVLLPTGWRIDYNRMHKNFEGFLVGPKGEEIVFPAYGGTGDLAAELRGADPEGIFTYAILDGREVNVAIARDGRLIVSYPRAWPPNHPSFSRFDFRTKVRTARETVNALLIMLTRVEAFKGPGFGHRFKSEPPRDEGGWPGNWVGPPLGWMSTPLGYSYRPSPKGDAPVARFESKGKPTVEAYLPGTKGQPSKPQWEETRTILGCEFHIAEGEKGGLVAWVNSPQGPSPVFATTEASPRAAVVLILMRLSFVKLEPYE